MQTVQQILRDLGTLVRAHLLRSGPELRLDHFARKRLRMERLADPRLDVAPGCAGREVLEVLKVIVLATARALGELLKDGLFVILVAPLRHGEDPPFCLPAVRSGPRLSAP